jgi:hypothetical protein
MNEQCCSSLTDFSDRWAPRQVLEFALRVPLGCYYSGSLEQGVFAGTYFDSTVMGVREKEYGFQFHWEA